MLTREQLLNIDDRKSEIFFVDEWNDEIKVRAISANQRRMILKESSVNGEFDMVKFQTMVVFYGTIEPKLEKADFDLLAEKNAFVIEKIATKIANLSGIEEDSVEEIRKN